MGVPLASAFVRIRPQADKAEFTRTGSEMGGAAGKGYGDGFYRDANGKLRQANGRFATDAQKAALEGGGKSGKAFAGAMNKESEGPLKRGFKKLSGELGPLLIPLGIGAAVGAIAKIGIQYEDNLNILQSVTKATGTEMDAVAKKARALGAATDLPGVSAAGAAAAMTELAKSGFTVQQAMDAAKGTLQLARIASLSEAKAAEITANAVNAFGLSAKDAGFVVDELAAAANSSSIEVSEASDSFKMAAAVYAGFQGPVVGSKEAITELNTAIAILGNNGIKGSDAGTSLKQMMLQLTGPSQQAKDIMRGLAFAAGDANVSLEQQNAILHGSKKQRAEAIAAVTQQNKGMADMGDIAFDAQGKMRPLSQIIDLVAKGTAGMTQEERLYAITQVFGADASRAVLSLLKGGLPVYEKQRQAVLQQGAAAAVAAAKNKGLGGAIDNVKGQFENAAIAIYNQVKGPLTRGLNGLANLISPVAGGIQRFGSFVAGNIGTIRDWALAIGLVTAALKLNSFMLTVQAAGGLVGWIKGARVAAGFTRAWAAAQVYLNATLIANPIGLVVIALAAIVGGLILAYRHSETFRKIVTGAWKSIREVVGVVVDWFTGTVQPALSRVWTAVAEAVTRMWTTYVRPALLALRDYIAKNVTPTVMAFWNDVVKPAFAAMGAIIAYFWANHARPALTLLWAFIKNILIPVLLFLWRNVVVPTFKAIAIAVAIAIKLILAGLADWMRILRTIVFPAIRTFLTIVQTVFRAVTGAIGTAGNTIKGFFSAMGGFVTKTLPNAFRTGVTAIGKAWDALKEKARSPVKFVVDHVINPFIGGFNSISGVFKGPQLSKIAFAAGGQVPRAIPGYASGGRIAGAPSSRDNRLAPATIPGVGAVKLAGGEFVVNAADTRKALPILKWINDGMRGGALAVAKRIGRPLTDRPGDGSEGWAFADGGLIGWVKSVGSKAKDSLNNIWDSISNPGNLIKKPFEAALRLIPGGGPIKEFLAAAANRLLSGALGWIAGSGGAGGDVGKIQSFIRAQAGKPYVWASAGPRGYDCSGIVSAAYNILKGKSPYNHTFSTGGLPDGFFREGGRGALMAGWSHPGQSPASSSTGHMAGQIGALPFESRGSRGVVVGGAARRISEFAHIGAARAAGGMIPGKGIRLFDKGGFWPSGTLGANMSGRTEYVRPAGAGGGGDLHVHIHNHGVIGSQDEMDRWVSGSLSRLDRQRKLPKARR